MSTKLIQPATLLSIKEASQELGISTTAVYENIRKGNLTRIDGITLDSIEKLKVNRKRKPSVKLINANPQD